MEKFTSFDQLKNEELIKGIYCHGFESPSEIQSVAIPVINNRQDCIIQNKSGTGKTGAFVIGGLSIIDVNINYPQVIIMNPTRELADQTYEVSKNISEYMKTSIGLYKGGVGINEYENVNQHNSIKYREQLIICTPGRLIDIINRNILDLSHLKLFVIDEADELLGKGFVDSIKNISSHLNPDVKIALFSATMTEEIIELSNNLILSEPFKHLLKNDQVVVTEIKQFYLNVGDEKNKLENILDIYKTISIQQSIIYCNRKETAQWLSGEFKAQSFSVAYIHSEMENNQRSSILKNFKNGQLNILVSTDLLSRGIDVQQLSLVINYDIPYKRENYIHRIGRSGRFGKKGAVINLVSADTLKELLEITNYYNASLEPLPNLTEF